MKPIEIKMSQHVQTYFVEIQIMSNIETLGIDLPRLGRDLVFETVKIFLAIEIDFLKLSRSRLLISTCRD